MARAAAVICRNGEVIPCATNCVKISDVTSAARSA
jgi:hypothetical protein